jgi:hypothetical protein
MAIAVPSIYLCKRPIMCKQTGTVHKHEVARHVIAPSMSLGTTHTRDVRPPLASHVDRIIIITYIYTFDPNAIFALKCIYKKKGSEQVKGYISPS